MTAKEALKITKKANARHNVTNKLSDTQIEYLEVILAAVEEKAEEGFSSLSDADIRVCDSTVYAELSDDDRFCVEAALEKLGYRVYISDSDSEQIRRYVDWNNHQ